MNWIRRHWLSTSAGLILTALLVQATLTILTKPEIDPFDVGQGLALWFVIVLVSAWVINRVRKLRRTK